MKYPHKFSGKPAAGMKVKHFYALITITEVKNGRYCCSYNTKDGLEWFPIQTFLNGAELEYTTSVYVPPSIIAEKFL